MNERGRKKVTCEQCGKSFVSFEDLTLHQSTEKGHITPNYLSKPTSVEVRTVHQSCIRLNWSPPMGIAVHQYYIQSYNPGKQEWSSLGVVHPQMPSFIINSDMLSDLCKPVAEIGICAVNVQQQCGPRYVVQFQKIPIQVNGMGVLEYKLEKTHWQKLDWKIHHSAPYQLKNLKTSGPVGTPEKLAARQTANKDILLSWCEPGVNRDEDQDLAISSHGNFTGYSIFISKVNSDTWACVKNLNEEVYSTVIPHENIPELSEYQVGIKAKKGFHTGPMAILCFHHMKPDGSVFVNELEPCKTCNALKTKSVRSFVTKGTGINRMEVDSDDDLQVDEDVFCLEKSSKTDVFQTANHDLKRAMGRKAVFFFANHFYQPVTELPISISNVHSDGCGKIRLKVSISQDLWRTLNTTLDDQGKPLYHVFLRMGRHYGDKFEDEIPECLISVNKRIVKVQPYMVYIHMVRKLGPKATVRRLLKERVVPQSRTKRLRKTDDVPQVKIENVEGESWSTENGGWYLSQYGLELKDNDVELVDAEVRQDIDQTDGMICDNNSSNLKVEDFSYSKDDNEAEDMSIQNIDIFPHKKGSAQDTSTSQIMIEDQESGKRVYLYENILSEDGDEFLSCESELEKRKSESLEGDHNVNNHDALGLAFNFTQATSSSQNSNVEETVTMDTNAHLINVEESVPKPRKDIHEIFELLKITSYFPFKRKIVCDIFLKTNYQHKKSYEDKALENAVSAVLQKGMSIRKAALEFGINMSTLHRRCQQTRPRKKEYQQKKKNRDEALQNAVSAVLQKGMSIRKAALEFGTNMSTLHRHCRHKGPRKKEYPHKKSYDDEALENAVSAVLQKGMSIRKAALEFGIPPSTLNKRCHQTGPRKKVYQHKKSYDDEALENAVSAVLQKGMSIRKAALEFGIPSSTLNERCHQTGPRNEEYQHKKTYGDEAFENAVSAVLQKGMSIRKAALEFGIPPTTLHERLKRKDPTDSIARKVGWQKDFSNNQEECLAELLLYMAAHGLPATRKMLRDRVKELLQISGTACRVNIEMGPSNHWLRGFVKRHLLFDHMAETRPPLDPPESIKEFFDMYEKTIVECGLQNKDDQIFNCDGTRWTEKSFKLCPKTGHQLEMKTGTGSHVTAHMCISAGGRFLPSMLIYKIFIPNCGMERPVLLVMNNLYNPVSIPTMLAAKENSIILFGVPGNSTHILHPLVVEIFGELQATVHDISSSQLDASKRVVIEKTEYPAILSQAIDQTAPESVQHAFEVTGLCPVNREAIDMSKLAQVKDEPEGRMDCAGPMVENEREVIDMNLYLASDTVFGLCDEQESESSQEDVQIQKGLTPCSTLIQGQKRIITTPAGKKKRITSRYIINSKIYLDEEITCKIFTCSECKMEYSYARMFEGAEQKMCLDCALEHNFLSKDLFTVLNTGNISLQPSYSHSRKFWCTKCRHKYGLSMLYKVNDLNMFCKNCALELNYISQGTGDQLSSIKLCSCSKCKKQQEDKEIAAENSRLKHKKQHKDKEIAAENSCLKHKKQHKDKEIAAENSCLKHKKQHKDKEIAAENSRLKHKKQHKDKDIAAENQTKLNQSKQNINVIKKLPIDEEQMVEENNDLTKKCYLPMCPAPRQCSNYNQAGICMKDNLTSRKIAFTNFVKKKIAAKMKQKGVALDESNHSKESELSHVDDPQHPDLGNSAKGTSKVCVICHTNQDGNNVVWYQNDSQQICPLCFQKKLVEKCIEANQKRRKIAATDFKRKKSAAKMKQKGVKLDVSNHCKKRGSSLVDTKQHPDLDNSAKDTSKVCFICHINQDGKKTVVWHQIDSKPICFLCFKKKMVEKGKKEKLTRKKIAFTNFVKKKLAAKMKQKGVTLDESNHCIESDSSHVDTPQHLDLGNSAKDTSNVCVICHTNQDGNKAAVRHQIDSQPICSWCFKKKQEEKGSTNKETPYVAENHCRNYQKDKDLEKDCNDEVCKNTSSKKNGKYSPFDSKVNNLKALNKDRQNNALKHCHSDESIVCILDSSTASPTYAIDMAYDINEPELNSDNYIEVLECDAGEFDNEGDGSNDHRNVQTNENSAIKHILQKKGSERDIEVTDNDDKGFDFFKHLRSYGIAKDKKTPFDPRTSNQSKNINSLKNQGLPEEMKGANPFCETEAHTKQEMITEVLVCTHCSLRDQAGCVHHWYNVGGNFYCSDCFSLFQSALQDNHVSERNTTKFCLFIRFKKLSNSSIFDVEGVEFTAQFEELAKHEQKGEIDNTSVKDTETSPNKSNSLSMRCILDYKGCCRSMKCSSLCQHFREWRCGQVPLSFISDCHVSLCRIDGVCKRCKVRHIKISALDNQGVNKRKLRGKESQN
ncbi:hypothetical protein MAR_020358 [Mya arenaria]|uniref:Uncharacterized protein n=1 Tax=Mya arenaria TaxID=6604 RepID=A0ABY7E752_MYAAR|nr:hypothetical protein MAR_020358 [Mya arenaria]